MPLASCIRAAKNFAESRAGKSPAILICSTISLAAALIFAIALAAAPRGNSDKDAAARAQAQALFQKALAVSDIRAPGSPSFELQGTIEIHESGGKEPHGTYDLKWAAPDKWREEIHFTDYSRIRFGGHNQYWQLRSLDHEILPLFNFSQAFPFARTLQDILSDSDWADKDKFSFKSRNADKQKLECVTVKAAGYPKSQSFCFDTLDGTLVREEDNFSSYGFNSLEFGEFTSFQGKQFPGTMRLMSGKDSPVGFQASSISPLGNAPDSLFTPPAGATFFADCAQHSPGAAKLSRDGPPIYPMNDRRANISGTVFIYGIIGADGLLHNLKVLAAPSPSLASSALQDVSGWRYTPSTCNGTPQPEETIIPVIFSIGY